MRKKITFILLLSFHFIISQSSIGEINGTSYTNYLGSSVALNANGSIQVVGSRIAGGSNANGEVKIFQRNGTTWDQLGATINGGTLDYSGTSVAISANGTRIVIGSPGNNFSRGIIKVYEYTGGVWTQIGNGVTGIANNDFFGTSVSISADGTKIASGGQNGNGYAKVFALNGANWEIIGQKIDGEASNDYFGSSLSLSSDGNVLAVSGRNNAVNGSATGHVRVFENVANNWNQIGNDIDGTAQGNAFGSTIALSGNGNRVIVSAPLNGENGTNAGQVKVFERNSNSWTQIGQNINGQTATDQFGSNVAINYDGTIIAISSTNNDSNGTNSGQIKIYRELNSNNWTQIGNDINGNQFENFGNGLSLSSDGNTLAASSIFYNSNRGIVRNYDLTAVLNINNFELSKQIIIYPNPVKDNLYIKNNDDFLFKNYSIIDLNGRRLVNKSQEIHNNTINLLNLSNGFYFLHLETDKGILVKQIIKE